MNPLPSQSCVDLSIHFLQHFWCARILSRVIALSLMFRLTTCMNSEAEGRVLTHNGCLSLELWDHITYECPGRSAKWQKQMLSPNRNLRMSWARGGVGGWSELLTCLWAKADTPGIWLGALVDFDWSLWNSPDAAFSVPHFPLSSDDFQNTLASTPLGSSHPSHSMRPYILAYI